MGRSILLAFDGSEPSEAAIEMAGSVFVDADVTVIHVLNPADYIVYTGMEGTVMSDIEHLQEEQESQAEELLERAERLAHEHGLEIDTAVETGDVAREVVAFAEDHDFDHILVGSHGRTGVQRILLGSVAEKIVRRAPVPVTVVR